jgi:uncharacterized protein YbjT (DUF2867 family)
MLLGRATKVLLFGASGMIGQGVLLECLDAPDVSSVRAIGRSPTSASHAKLEEVSHSDFLDLSALAGRLSGFDTCFFCLGVSSAGMSEADYTRVTHDFAVAVAKAVLRESPSVVFCFVSGAGTDSTEKGRSMWACVKGKTEERAPRDAVSRGGAQRRGRTDPGGAGDQRPRRRREPGREPRCAITREWKVP